MSTTCSDCGTDTYTDSFGETWWERGTGDGYGTDGHQHNADGPQNLSAAFTLDDLDFYATIIDGTRRQARCVWLTDLGEEFGGTLRHMHGAISNSDVRTLSVRITTRTGGELNIPIYQLRQKLRAFRVR